MQIRGRVLSVSGDVAEVCIVKENKQCGSCSTCPKKIAHDVLKVAAVKGVEVGCDVVLNDNRNWFARNKIVCAVIVFVAGVILAEAISIIVPFGVYRKELDILAGGLVVIIVFIILWVKRPRYPFRIAFAEGRKI